MMLNRKCCLFAAVNLLSGLFLSPVATANITTKIDNSVAQLTDTTHQEDEMPVYVDVVLNQMPVRQLVQLTDKHGILYVPTELLTDLGIVFPHPVKNAMSLNELDAEHILAHYIPEKLELQLTVPGSLLTGKTQVISLREKEQTTISNTSPSLLFNYSAYATNFESTPQGSLWHEIRLSGLADSSLSNSMQTQSGREGNSTLRLDTTWSQDNPESMLSINLGDITTQSLDWSRSTRLGGIQLSRDFSLQPYTITTPMSSFVGSATLPSQVDLYIDGIKQASQKVSPGQFQLQNVQIASGASQATMNITDITGQTRSVSLNVYGAPELLRKGLLDWSFEAGVVRERWGESSFVYADEPMVSMTTRYGTSQNWTLTSHTEGDKSQYTAGLGSVFLFPLNLGVFDMAWSRSGIFSSQAKTDVISLSNYDDKNRSGKGSQQLLGYRWNNKTLTISASTIRRNQQYRDIASRYSANLMPEQQQLFLGLSTSIGQLSSGFIQQKDHDAQKSQYMSVNWSKQFVHLGSFFISLNRQLDSDKGFSSSVSWSLPLDDRVVVNSNYTRSKEHQNIAFSAAKNATRLGEPGWRIQGTGNQLSQHNLQAEWRYMNAYGDFGMGAGYWRNEKDTTTTSYFSANGAGLMIDNQFFAMRSTADAFALVSTNGVPDVPVKLENRLVGKTSQNGYFLINDLNAWQHNQVGIDPLALPSDVSIGQTAYDVIPRRGSGSIVRFDINAQQSLQLVLKTVSGEIVPAGSPVWTAPVREEMTIKLSQQPEVTQVGYDGLLYLETSHPDSRLIVGLDGEHYCYVNITKKMVNYPPHRTQAALCY
ncbi:fimbria/pilus outer membrane usher protein [Enterobacter cloacae complex sp. ESBL7]